MHFGGGNEVKHHGGILILRTQVRIVRVLCPDIPDGSPDIPDGVCRTSGLDVSEYSGHRYG